MPYGESTCWKCAKTGTKLRSSLKCSLLSHLLAVVHYTMLRLLISKKMKKNINWLYCLLLMIYKQTKVLKKK